MLTEDENTDYTKRGEVMNPPESAAQGSEARNLNTPHCDGTGAVPGSNPEADSVRATHCSAAPNGQHAGFYYCKHCGLDLTPDIQERHGLYNDSPGSARSVG